MAMANIVQKLLLSALLLAFAACINANVVHEVISQTGCNGGDTPLCCDSSDSTCRVHGAQKKNASSEMCFCDNKCLEVGDCCMDYEETCKPVDCVLDDWSPYGPCDSFCGWGLKEREKRILVHPKNGGQPCGKRREQHRCKGHKCKNPRSYVGGFRELRETGMILPAQYGNYRENKKYNPYRGIRKNLFDHYKSNSILDHPTYCATYEITDTRKSCRSKYFASWAPGLEKGAHVCVECQPLAMKKKLGMRCHGHGVFGKETRWNAVTVPGCHGKWEMKTQHEECSCSTSRDPAFILV